ncbi:MAG: FHA domain-containing protein [Verrucomicrobiales bacterium]|nr:FHA domain-containing protein [Verrucomicrobiales bacterium]
MRVSLKRKLDSGETQNFDLKENRVTIGRDPHNNISVDETWISSRHAIITCNGDDEFSIQDCESRNGTFVNQDKVKDIMPFKIGDVIRIAYVDFEVIEKPPSNAIPVIPLSERRKSFGKVNTR